MTDHYAENPQVSKEEPLSVGYRNCRREEYAWIITYKQHITKETNLNINYSIKVFV